MISPRLHWLMVALLLGAFFLQSALAWRTKSPTFDEPVHLAAGWASLRSGDSRLSFEHPPFLEQWAALPLLAMDLGRPEEYPGWEEASRSQLAYFLFFDGQDFRRVFFLARLSMILLATCMGLVVYFWAKELWGANAALFSLALFAFSPNLLAHAAIVSTDFGAASFGVLSLWTWSRMLDRPTWSRTIAAALATGLVFLTKFSMLTLSGVWLAWLIISCMKHRNIGVLATRCLLIGFVAISMVLLDYRGDISAVCRALDVFVTHSGEGHHTYLLGQPGYRGWHHYFLVAWFVKTPLPEIILFVWAIISLGLKPDFHRKHILLTFPFLLVLVMFSFARVCIGYRHILVLVPIGMLMAGGALAAAPHSQKLRPFWRVGLSGLLAWQIIGSLAVFPNYLTFFNEGVGGPKNGWRYLSDSNLDWGQDASTLGEWMRANSVPHVRLAYFGMIDPSLYGVNYARLPGYNNLQIPVEEFDHAQPTDGIYAISATCLTGQYLNDADTYAWFRKRKPDERIGNSIFLYYVIRSRQEETEN